MKAPPKGLSPEASLRHIEQHIAEKYAPDGTDRLVCKECGSNIAATTCYISIHYAEFGEVHAGSGGVKKIGLPYCPKCEGEPMGEDACTCVHVPIPQEIGV